MDNNQPQSPRRRLQVLLAIPDSQRTEDQWDEIVELEIQLAPGNREDGPGRDMRAVQPQQQNRKPNKPQAQQNGPKPPGGGQNKPAHSKQVHNKLRNKTRGKPRPAGSEGQAAAPTPPADQPGPATES